MEPLETLEKEWRETWVREGIASLGIDWRGNEGPILSPFLRCFFCSSFSSGYRSYGSTVLYHSYHFLCFVSWKVEPPSGASSVDRSRYQSRPVPGWERLTQFPFIFFSLLPSSYVLCEPPSNAILARVRPHIYLPAIMVLWGGVAMCFAACTTWQGVVACRLFLGIFEAGFSPGEFRWLSVDRQSHPPILTFSFHFQNRGSVLAVLLASQASPGS